MAIDLPPEPWTNGQTFDTPNGPLVYNASKGAWQAPSVSSPFPDSGGLQAEIDAILVRLDDKLEEADLAEFLPSPFGRSQTLSDVEDDTPIDLLEGASIFVVSTAGTWTPSFLNRPAGVTEVRVVMDASADDHDMLVPAGFVWEGTPLTVGDVVEGKRYLYEFMVLPDGTGTVEWLGEATDTPGYAPDIDPPTLAIKYSTSQSRTSPLDLDGATVPNPVVVFFTASDESVVSYIRVFVNHVGALPALGEETTVTTWAGNRTPPYSLLGSVSGSPSLSEFWDTLVDPTGNANVEYDDNGENTIRIDAVLVDDTLTADVLATFDTDNPAPTADPTWTLTHTPYTSATATHPITVPSGEAERRHHGQV
jgi:hypothetical protein